MHTKTWKSHQSMVHRIFFTLFVSEGTPFLGLHWNKHMASKLILVSKRWKNYSTMITFSKSYLWCISFQVLCTNFLVVQELPNVRNNWKSHCAWPFQLLCTHTLYLYERNLTEYSKTISNHYTGSKIFWSWVRKPQTKI